MKKVKPVLLTFALLLFVFNYAICEYYYPGTTNLKGWWFMKSDIYSITIMLILLSCNIGTTGLMRFIFSVGIGFSISDVVDRCYFSSRDFNETDIVMIILVFIFAGVDWFINSKYYKAL